MSNPTFTRAAAEGLARSRGCQDKVMLLGFRSATSKYGEYDDTLALLTPDSYTEWKGNTLPSKWEEGIARLEPGDYQYVKGLHGIHHFDDIEAALGKARRDEVESFLQTHLVAAIDYPHQLQDAHGKPLILPYPAFRQHGPVTLIRDGAPATETETDPARYPFIDLHCGGWNGTSSAGCQTWHPDHWKEAREAGYEAMDGYGQAWIIYSLHQL